MEQLWGYLASLGKYLIPREPAAGVVVLVLLLAFVWAVGVLWWAGRAVRRDQRALVQWSIQTDALPPSEDAAGGPALSPEASPRPDYGLRLERRLKLQNATAEHAAAVSDILEDLDRSELEGAVRPARFLAAIGVFIGLMGTILGLAGALSGMADLPSSEKVVSASSPLGEAPTRPAQPPDTQKLYEQLASALDRMSTGFSCTFFGVLVTVLIGYGLYRYQSAVEDLLADYSRVLTLEVLRNPSFAAAELDVSRFPEALHTAAHHLSTTLQPFSVSLSEGGKAINAATTRLSRTVPALEQFRASLEGIVACLGGDLGNLARAETDSRRQVQTLVEELRGLARTAAESASTAAESARLTAEEGIQTRQSADRLNTSFQDFVVLLKEHLAAEHRQREADRHQLDAAVDHLNGAVGTLAGSLQEALRDHPVLEPVRHLAQNVSLVGERLDGNLRQGEYQAEQVVDSITHLAQRFNQFSDELRQHFHAETTARKQEAETLLHAFRGLINLLDMADLGVEQAPRARQELETLSRVAQQDHTELARTNQVLQQAAGSLGQVNEQLARAVQTLEERQRALQLLTKSAARLPSAPPHRRWWWPFN